jgi:hypothetical protein
VANKKAAFVSHHKRQDATKSATLSSNPPEQEQEHEEDIRDRERLNTRIRWNPENREQRKPARAAATGRGRRETLELGSPSPPHSPPPSSSSAPVLSESRTRRTCPWQWNIILGTTRRSWRRHLSPGFLATPT